MKRLLIITAVIAILISNAESNGICKANEESTACGAHPCLDTCANPNLSQNCKWEKKCYPGCICIKGFLRNYRGECVKRCHCSKCPVNEVYSVCDNHPCRDTCANPHFSQVCRYIPGCYPGCICKNGYLRNDKGVCVPRKHCAEYCPPNEVWNPSPKPCSYDKTCQLLFTENELYDHNCPLPPKNFVAPPRCECIRGYYRNSHGFCVPPSKCCPEPNSQLVKCPNPCPGGTCAHPTFLPCRMMCRPYGCQCKNGYVKKSSINPTCIKKSKC